MEYLGTHVIVDFANCDSKIIDDPNEMEKIFVDAAKAADTEVLGHSFFKFKPQGVSGTVVIAESHLSMHSWPEFNYVAADFFTCGDKNPRVAMEYIKERLGPKCMVIAREDKDRGRLKDILKAVGRTVPETVSYKCHVAEAGQG